MARKTISEEKQNLIRKRLLQGHSIKDIAQETGVSEKTVSKYKKNYTNNLAQCLVFNRCSK